MATYKKLNRGTFTINLAGETVERTIPRNAFWQYESETHRQTAIKNAEKRPILLVGFDTEFQSPEALLREQVFEGKGRYEVLSYQFYCKVMNPTGIAELQEREWQGLCIPEIGEDGLEKRLSLSQFLVFALGSGFAEHEGLVVPDEIYLVGHFTKADLPAFSDFIEITRNELDNVRRTLVDLKGSIEYVFVDEKTELSIGSAEVNVRDTYLNAPTMAKSLADLGEIVGFEKIKLADDVLEEKEIKSNMRAFRNAHWEKFHEYAIRDCIVCAKYFEQVLNAYFEITGKYQTPFTLSSIGMDLIFQNWKKNGMKPNKLLGKEMIEYKHYNKKYHNYVDRPRKRSLSKVYFQEAFATETYHGGRNEQFWFGPGFEDDWYDYDLQSAYPTAMALIGLPKWKKIRVIEKKKQLENIAFDELCFVCVKFKFPDTVRYPVLPVRSISSNLIFPLEGESYCTIAELRLAESLGATYKLEYAVHVPSDKDSPIFRDFIRDCIDKRSKYPKGTFYNYFWKEVGNSTYGKTAQGLRLKRAYDIRSDETKPTPESKLTNPFFSSFITGFTRATLGEMMNGLPEDRMVFSVTTDGFLTNARPEELAALSDGVLAKRFFESRQQLVGTSEPITEIKHQIRQPLGWRTRGQATIKKGAPPLRQGAKDLICAKAGIKVEHYYDDEQQNIEIVEKFVNRKPTDKVTVRPFVSIKDQLRYGNDNVEFILERVLSMEYDWKRNPFAGGDCRFDFNGDQHAHLCMNTRPWKSVDQFRQIRERWDDYRKAEGNKIINLKTVEDLLAFFEFANERINIGEENRAYMKRKSGAANRVMTSVISALFHARGGFKPLDVQKLKSKQNKKVADILRSAGINCSASDVANHKIKQWEPGRVPNTETARRLLEDLKEHHWKNLDVDAFIWAGSALTLKLDDDPFVERTLHPSI